MVLYSAYMVVLLTAGALIALLHLVELDYISVIETWTNVFGNQIPKLLRKVEGGRDG